MYEAILKLNDKEFIGTLDFLALKNIQKVFKKVFNKELTIEDIFKKIYEKEMKLVLIFILETTKRKEDKTIEINTLLAIEKDLEINYKNIFEYTTQLMFECLPKREAVEESEFEDEDEEQNIEDWEFGWMEYMWNTTLKRTDFWSITPKNFFEQMDIYKKVNNVKSKDENIEEL